MAKREEVFASKYLKAVDLKGRPHVVEIEECWQENLKTGDGKERNKTIVKFTGKNKTLVMNMCNWDAVADITGEDDTIAWPGHSVEIYPTKTTMGGKTVDCIRVRKPSGETAEAVAPKVRPSLKDGVKSVGAMLSDDMDDEIPF